MPKSNLCFAFRFTLLRICGKGDFATFQCFGFVLRKFAVISETISVTCSVTCLPFA